MPDHTRSSCVTADMEHACGSYVCMAASHVPMCGQCHADTATQAAGVASCEYVYVRMKQHPVTTGINNRRGILL